MTGLASKAQLRASFFRWALFVVPAVMLLAFLAAQLSMDGPNSAWYNGLDKPAFNPPSYLFGIVWPILYFLMGIALALVCAAWGARGRTMAIVVFVVQFLVNLTWSPIYFNFQQIDVALGVILVLDVLVIATIILFWKVRRLAALLLLPYLAWILFATALNYEFLRLNPGASGEGSEPAVQRIEL
ncbi:TspO/MBR family protein [Parerythrobacter jejuensis]|uniref:Tryptophan-rich sensory protein n=1 Tax=Parerythrobacter jejuensis TaxID=795812 RepID=A0A845B1B4_9SPHN|nr:TspO/MBR family protein [Parerythrobacter jejuensis]MXP32778.1 tryptophan-rich sensory protein [Parerythrobacter jejuensis]